MIQKENIMNKIFLVILVLAIVFSFSMALESQFNRLKEKSYKEGYEAGFKAALQSVVDNQAETLLKEK